MAKKIMQIILDEAVYGVWCMWSCHVVSALLLDAREHLK